MTKPNYDLIIVSKSGGELTSVTENCIASARKDGEKLHVIVIETGEPTKYDADLIIPYEGEFNYNHALNMGLKHIKCDFQILANNDIIFHKGWTKIGPLMKANGYLSASALSNDIRQSPFRHGDFAYEGYEIGMQLTGWCIFTDIQIWNRIGKLSEAYPFWFADNAYGAQLENHGIKHALICSVRVDHLGSQTLTRETKAMQRYWTRNGGKVGRSFNKKRI